MHLIFLKKMLLKVLLFEMLLIIIFSLKTFLRDLFNTCLKGTTSDFFQHFISVL